MATIVDFLGRICKPAAEEFLLGIQDQRRNWRNHHLLQVIQKAESKLSSSPGAEKKHSPPRLVAVILEQASWIENEMVLDMWAGLLATSCSEDGQDEGNYVFIHLLSQITSLQALILNHACETAEKYVTRSGCLAAKDLLMSLEEIQVLAGIVDRRRVARELDHLFFLGLIEGGYFPASLEANITPRPLALQMYVSCQGYIGSPAEYFGLQEKEIGFLKDYQQEPVISG